MVFAVPQSRLTAAATVGHITTLDSTGCGVPLDALAVTPDTALRSKFPSIGKALDHFAKVGGVKYSLKITWPGYEGMDFTYEVKGMEAIKGVAKGFDRFLHQASLFNGCPPAPHLRAPQYTLRDLVLTGIITCTGNIFQAEVQVAGSTRA